MQAVKSLFGLQGRHNVTMFFQTYEDVVVHDK